MHLYIHKATLLHLYIHLPVNVNITKHRSGRGLKLRQKQKTLICLYSENCKHSVMYLLTVVVDTTQELFAETCF